MSPRPRLAGLLLAATVLAAACSSAGPEAASTTAADSTSPTVAAPASTTTAAPAASTTATAAPAPTTPAVPEGTNQLQGLGFDEFVEESFEVLLLRSPQLLTEMGLAERFGLRNDRLDDLSDAFIKETMAIESELLDQFRRFDRSALDRDRQVIYDAYGWYLDDLVRGHRFVYHDYLVHQFIRSYHFNTFSYFTDGFPLETSEDAEDFVIALSQVRRQADQVLEGLRIRESKGIVAPDFVLQMAIGDMGRQVQRRSSDPSSVDPKKLEIYSVFAERLEDIPDLDDADRVTLLEAAELQLRESFIPAWFDLIAELQRLGTVATSDAGVWKLPDGDAYYAYMLRKETSTDLTPQQIHELGLTEVERIRAEMSDHFARLGYPPGESFADGMQRIRRDSGFIDTRTEGPGPLIAAYEELLAGADARVEDFFGLRPSAGLEVVAEMSFGGGGGYYSSGALDGSRPGAFHTGAAPSLVDRAGMPTIAYHEGIPGHHFQIALAQELDLPLFQSIVFFNGYVEGWALYAEYLATEMGLYDDDPYGDVGRLDLELLRAVRLVTDTGIHSMGWTREEAKAYMRDAMGQPGGGSDHEVDRYVVLPGQATGYKIGMLEILAGRARAEEQLGDAFDIRTFHDVVLSGGAVPLAVLGRMIDDWIESAAG